MTYGRESRQGPTSIASERGATETLTLPDELILMLLNEENGYFHQVPGWNLNCVVIGAVLAELSLMNRIDTDLESLFLVDQTETGNPVLDPVLKTIASQTGTHSCLGSRWMELQLAVNVMMLARHFTFEVSLSKYKDKLKINSLPSLKPHKSLKLLVTEKRGL